MILLFIHTIALVFNAYAKLFNVEMPNSNGR